MKVISVTMMAMAAKPHGERERGNIVSDSCGDGLSTLEVQSGSTRQEGPVLAG